MITEREIERRLARIRRDWTPSTRRSRTVWTGRTRWQVPVVPLRLRLGLPDPGEHDDEEVGKVCDQ